MPTGDDSGPSRDGVRTLSGAAALNALANPVRTRVMDVLRIDGPATASMLADRIGQAIGSVSHHCKVLAEAGLIVEAPELAKDRRERWWRPVTQGLRWSRDEFADDADAVTAALAAESLELTREYQAARDWLDDHEAAGPWTAAALATRWWLKLTPQELSELSAELHAVLRRWYERGRPGPDAEDAAVDPARETVLFFARAFPARP